MEDYVQLAAAMRAQRQQQEMQRRQSAMQGGAATNMTQGQPVMGGSVPAALGNQPQSQQQPQTTSSLGSNLMDGYSNYLKASKAFTPAAASGAELGGSLTGGSSGLGAMLGSYGSTAAPSTFGTLGSTTSGGLGAMLGGGNAATAGASTGYGGAAAGGAAGGAMSAAGPIGMYLAGAKALNDNGVSSYGSTFSGKAPAKMIDEYLPGIADSAVGNFGKSMGSFFMGDMGGFAKNGWDAAKDFFTLDWI